MEEEKTFHIFVTSVANMPHIAENILRRLTLCDIANCLRTSKDFRRFITTAFQSNESLQTELEDIATRSCITDKPLGVKQYCPIIRDNWELNTCHERRFGFGIDDSFLLCGCASSSYDNIITEGTLSIYDMHGYSKTKTLSLRCESRPRVKILPGKKILLQDNRKYRVLGKDSDCGKYKILAYHILSSVPNSPPPTAFVESDGIVRSLEPREDETLPHPWILGFCNFGDDPLWTDSEIGLTEYPSQILQKGRCVMVIQGSYIKLFSSSSGQLFWSKTIPDNVEVNLQDAILTESFCGYMYTDVIEKSRRDIKGFYKLRLLDNSTGQEIFHETCWNFYHKFGFGHASSDELPMLAANGNYFFACSRHGGGYDNKFKHQLCNDTLMCLKVNPERKTCVVRYTKEGLEDLLLAKALLCRNELKNLEDSDIEAADTDSTSSCRIDGMNILGFALESVILCQAYVYYRFPHSEDAMFSCKGNVVFSVELDTILEMHESAGESSAVHFPLHKNVFDNFGRKRDNLNFAPLGYPTAEDPRYEYYPYFETRGKGEEEKIVLTGIMEITDDKESLLEPKIYSFRIFLQAKDLTDLFEREPCPRKCIKLSQT